MATGGLTRWFKEQWVDLSRPKEGGGFEPCGRPDADEGKYPKCVPASRAAKMTEAEIKSAVRRKRRAESTQRREGKKPINVSTEVEKKNVPTNPELYAKVKAEAKRKFDVYPSAYANGWLVQEYKRRGGEYKTISKHLGSAHDQMTHGRKKTATGLTAVREAAAGTGLDRHPYDPDQVLGQQSFFTDEPYEDVAHAKYRAGGLEVVDRSPMPKAFPFGESLSEEEAMQVAKDIFELTITDDRGDTYTAEILYVGEGSSVSLVGVLNDASGDPVGRFERDLRSEGEVYNASFKIDLSLQGRGIGTTILRHWEDQLGRAGFETMYVNAASGGSMNGGYTWAKYGYYPESGTANSLLDDYVKNYIYTDDDDMIAAVAKPIAKMFNLPEGRIVDVLKSGDYEFGYDWGAGDNFLFFNVSDAIGEDLIYLADEIPGFRDYLKSDATWDGSKDIELLDISKKAGYPKAVLEVINRWMATNPAGLENDDPEFWKEIRMAYKKVRKDNPTPNAVHVASIMGSKPQLRRKRRRMDEALGKKEPIKDPKGGLTAAGRRHFKEKEGANLKPGVKGPADTPEKMRRKGSFLTRFYTNPSGPLTNDKGEPTRLALAAAAWGEPIPKNRSDAAKLAAKGRRLLERYENVKKHAEHDQKTHGRRSSSFSERMSGVSPNQAPSVVPALKSALASATQEESDGSSKTARLKGDVIRYVSGGKQYEFKVTGSASEWEGDGEGRWSADVTGLNNSIDVGSEGTAADYESAKTAMQEWVVSTIEASPNVSKHGGSSHDQKTHGRRKGATGGGEGAKGGTVTERLVRATGQSARQLKALAKKGGFTYNPKTDKVADKGFVSAIDQKYEARVPASKFSVKDIRAYAKKHADILSQPGHHLGAWRETVNGEDLIFLDVSVVKSTIEEAADIGRQYNQLGIFDLNTFTQHDGYRNPDGKVVYMPMKPYLEGMYEMGKADKMSGKERVMFVPGTSLDERSLERIVAQLMGDDKSDEDDEDSSKNS